MELVNQSWLMENGNADAPKYGALNSPSTPKLAFNVAVVTWAYNSIQPEMVMAKIKNSFFMDTGLDEQYRYDENYSTDQFSPENANCDDLYGGKKPGA